MSLHDTARMVRQNRQRNRVILTVEPCRFLGHLQFGHEIVQHVDVRFKSHSDSSHVVLLVDQFGFVEDTVESRTEYFVAIRAIDSDEVVVDERGHRRSCAAYTNRVTATVDDDPSATILAPSHIINTI